MDERTLGVLRVATPDLSSAQTSQLRDLLSAAFADDQHGGFSEHDWQHALGGRHYLIEIDGRIVSHAAAVERELQVAGWPLRTGYVEAVATAPEFQRRGYGTAIMRHVNADISAEYELGALGTGSHAFYRRLGWRTWRGPSYVRTPAGLVATPEEDGYILVLLTPSSQDLNLAAPISCDWRPGDVW